MGGEAPGGPPAAVVRLLTRPRAVRAAVVLLALLAAPRAGYETRRLLFGQTWYDATDIRNFHGQTVTWLSGQDLYATSANADYPPASYPLMAPMYILPNDVNRWVWFAHAALVLGLLVRICVRESGAETAEERWAVALLPLAMYGTGVAFGNGQLVIHSLTAATVGMLLLYESDGRWRWELGAAACMLFALVKPSLTAPFFWLFLLVPRRKHAAGYVLVGYAALTLLGASVQPSSLMDQFRGFIARGTEWAGSMTGYGGVPIWLAESGRAEWIMPFTVLALLAMGAWVWRNRDADKWLLFGALALMTRLWAYHQLYDDMLNLPAFIAVIRLATGRAGNREPDKLAWLILLVALTTIPGPATPLRFWSGWLSVVTRGWQTAVRVVMLAFLMQRAWRQVRRTGPAGRPAAAPAATWDAGHQADSVPRTF